jgi:tRNA(Ile)-lysidine synthase
MQATVRRHLIGSPQSSAAVGKDEFARLFGQMLDKMPTLKGLLSSRKVGIAVSGGPDSLALCLLAKQVIPAERLVAFTVDHKLQALGIHDEPDQVSEALQALGIRHEVLPLDWSAIYVESLSKGRLQETCRQLRYEALFKACRRADVPLLLTGHNLDDDVVTMFYRLAHLSGLDGLAGMKAATCFPVASAAASRFFVGHPLMTVPKGRLQQTCADWADPAGVIQPVHDASNDDLDYRRNSLHDALRAAQSQNPVLTLEALQRTLGNFKRVRADLHDELVRIFDRSVIVNKVNGDCTLILNDPAWLHQRHLATRLLMLLLQYSAAQRYPARTPSVLSLYGRLVDAYAAHAKDSRQWLSRLAAVQQRPYELQPFDKTRRIAAFSQHTLANCTVYPLSRTDALRRISLQERLFKRKLEYGPAFLIQRDPPARGELQASGKTPITLGPTDSHLWDGRIHLAFEHVPSLECPSPAGARTFTAAFMTPADVKDFEAATKAMPSARRHVYAYLGTTPGSHLYQIPVVREVGSNYMAFPTLKADYPPGKYKWKTQYAGTPILMSRFLCLP